MKFEEADLGVISNALRVAAEHFRENISHLKDTHGHVVNDGVNGFSKLSEQFARQACNAERLYNVISEKTGIAL